MTAQSGDHSSLEPNAEYETDFTCWRCLNLWFLKLLVII